MIKKLLPAMIGAALVGGMTVASADVSVVGHIDTSVLNYDADISASVDDGEGGTFSASASPDDTNFVCTTCSVGFKGSEDLGNGLKAIFFLDFQYDTNNTKKGSDDDSITDRDQWLGLDTAAGQFRVGTISTGYKSHGAMIDPMYRTVVQARDVGLQSNLHSGAGEEGQGRATNTFRWDSVDYNGLKLVAHYTLDSSEGDGEDDDPFGVGASYENGGILVFADYLTNDGSDSNEAGDMDAWKIGGKYSMNDFSVFGQYEDIQTDHIAIGSFIDSTLGISEDDLCDGNPVCEDVLAEQIDVETTVWHLGGTYTMGSNTLYGAYGQGEFDVDGSVDYDTWSIGGMHTFTKSTSVYAAYNNFDIDESGFSFEQDSFAIGMKHKF